MLTLKELRLSQKAYREVLGTRIRPLLSKHWLMLLVPVPGVGCSGKLWFNFCPRARACQDPQDPPPSSGTMCITSGT